MRKESGRLRAVCEATPATALLAASDLRPESARSCDEAHNAAIETQEYAQQGLETHGDKAVVVATKRARLFEEKGNREAATIWRKIEAGIKLMRGPHQR